MPSTKAPSYCTICCSEVHRLRESPANCSPLHKSNERACEECWEAHLSLKIEQRDPRMVRCLFCLSIMDDHDIKSLSSAGTVRRYNRKLQDNTSQLCHIRCPKSKAHGEQQHDRQQDGRVFACAFCHFETCIDCDRPEHTGESCYDYRTRVVFNPKHVKDEAATRAKFKSCPQCDTIFVLEKGAGCYFQCVCTYQFCENRKCLIPWVGEDSAYLGGRKAHFEGCKYRIRDKISDHTLKNRFEDDEETKQRVEERKAQNKEKLEAKKAAKAAQLTHDHPEERALLKSDKTTTSNGEVKKRKRAGLEDGHDNELLSRKRPKKD